MNTFINSDAQRSYTSSGFLPWQVTKEEFKGSRDVNILTHLFTQGTLYIAGEINQVQALEFSMAMSVLASEKINVKIILDSPGGEVTAGMMIYDVIQAYPYDIDIYCAGIAASMGAVILAGGQKGRRYILPHSKVMIHEPLIAGGMGGSATTIEKTAQSILETKSMLSEILAKHTGKTVDEINKATLYDNYMNAKEAIAFGLCDRVRDLF